MLQHTLLLCVQVQNVEQVDELLNLVGTAIRLNYDTNNTLAISIPLVNTPDDPKMTPDNVGILHIYARDTDPAQNYVQALADQLATAKLPPENASVGGDLACDEEKSDGDEDTEVSK